MLVDTGAYAVLVLAIYCIVANRRLLTPFATAAAVLAREFSIAVVAFGVVRDLRRGISPLVVLATYSPAIAAFFAVRSYVSERWRGESEQLVTGTRLLDNLSYWNDPVYAGFFLYFALTVFGGISLFVAARAALAARHFAREPEWLAFCALILAAAAVGDADMWRYLAYLLPMVVVLFAVCAREMDLRGRRVIIMAALVCGATWLTQRPLKRIDVPTYFLDWFPYYIQKGNVPFEPIVSLWPVWAWRLMTAFILLWAMAAVPSFIALRPQHANRT